IDKDNKLGLPGVTLLIDSAQGLNSITDENGHFTISNIPLGKHSVFLSSIGYLPLSHHEVLFTSGKEVWMTFEMEERANTLSEVQVWAQRQHDEVFEMATVSAKTFDVQETERFAGSRGDPARMASNYAGVQGGDDSRNDIIVRGNSPQGILWRLEDVDIPSPNHFAVPGTTGGPVSMLNNKVLGNSSFYTGAFPAAFGNAIGGVFDLKFRNGNRDKHEL